MDTYLLFCCRNLLLDLVIVYSFIQLYELCRTICPVTSQCIYAVIRIYLKPTNNIFPLIEKNNVIVLFKFSYIHI